MNWKITRRITLGVILVFFIVIARTGGVFIDLFVLLLYGMGLLGIYAWEHIYLGGLDRIAKKNAEAIVEAQRKANEK